MEGFKEFQGKNLDEAIKEACAYYNAAREKLEIEILEDAKSGIFGIVGARKAKVRARRAQLREAVESIFAKSKGRENIAENHKGRTAAAAPETGVAAEAAPETGVAAEAALESAPAAGAASCACKTEVEESASRPSPAESAKNSRAESAGRRDSRDSRDNRDNRDGRHNRRDEQSRHAEQQAESAPAQGEVDGRSTAEGAAAGREPGRGREKREGRGASEERNPRRSRDERGRDERGRVESAETTDDDLDEVGEGLPVLPFEQLDAAKLEALAQEAVLRLVRPIVGEAVRLETSLVGGRVQVSVDCDEDSGLLIGREGQTLAALQYLASRMVSRGMNAAVRVQLDAGEYRRRQDDKLRETALALAEKVRRSGRSYSTRPLSSYHRRIVHVCLQEVEDVQTRSTGDGPLKRVVIQRRRGEKSDKVGNE